MLWISIVFLSWFFPTVFSASLLGVGTTQGSSNGLDLKDMSFSFLAGQSSKDTSKLVGKGLSIELDHIDIKGAYGQYAINHDGITFKRGQTLWSYSQTNDKYEIKKNMESILQVTREGMNLSGIGTFHDLFYSEQESKKLQITFCQLLRYLTSSTSTNNNVSPSNNPSNKGSMSSLPSDAQCIEEMSKIHFSILQQFDYLTKILFNLIQNSKQLSFQTKDLLQQQGQSFEFKQFKQEIAQELLSLQTNLQEMNQLQPKQQEKIQFFTQIIQQMNETMKNHQIISKDQWLLTQQSLGAVQNTSQQQYSQVLASSQQQYQNLTEQLFVQSNKQQIQHNQTFLLLNSTLQHQMNLTTQQWNQSLQHITRQLTQEFNQSLALTSQTLYNQSQSYTNLTLQQYNHTTHQQFLTTHQQLQSSIIQYNQSTQETINQVQQLLLGQLSMLSNLTTKQLASLSNNTDVMYLTLQEHWNDSLLTVNTTLMNKIDLVQGQLLHDNIINQRNLMVFNQTSWNQSLVMYQTLQQINQTMLLLTQNLMNSLENNTLFLTNQTIQQTNGLQVQWTQNLTNLQKILSQQLQQFQQNVSFQHAELQHSLFNLSLVNQQQDKDLIAYKQYANETWLAHQLAIQQVNTSTQQQFLQQSLGWNLSYQQLQQQIWQNHTTLHLYFTQLLQNQTQITHSSFNQSLNHTHHLINQTSHTLNQTIQQQFLHFLHNSSENFTFLSHLFTQQNQFHKENHQNLSLSLHQLNQTFHQQLQTYNNSYQQQLSTYQQSVQGIQQVWLQSHQLLNATFQQLAHNMTLFQDSTQQKQLHHQQNMTKFQQLLQSNLNQSIVQLFSQVEVFQEQLSQQTIAEKSLLHQWLHTNITFLQEFIWYELDLLEEKYDQGHDHHVIQLQQHNHTLVTWKESFQQMIIAMNQTWSQQLQSTQQQILQQIQDQLWVQIQSYIVQYATNHTLDINKQLQTWNQTINQQLETTQQTCVHTHTHIVREIDLLRSFVVSFVPNTTQLLLFNQKIGEVERTLQELAHQDIALNHTFMSLQIHDEVHEKNIQQLQQHMNQLDQRLNLQQHHHNQINESFTQQLLPWLTSNVLQPMQQLQQENKNHQQTILQTLQDTKETKSKELQQQIQLTTLQTNVQQLQQDNNETKQTLQSMKQQITQHEQMIKTLKEENLLLRQLLQKQDITIALLQEKLK